MTDTRLKPEELRSYRWIGPDDLRSFGHRSRIYQMGYAEEEYQGKPIIGILNTWSDLSVCHTHFPERVDAIKRGIWQAGGFPVEIPVMSVNETFMKPTSMFYRNLLAMEVEEMIHSQPLDGLVLMGGCDKTTPGLLMGVASADVPAIFFPAGPMMPGNWNGQTLGSGTDSWKYWAERQAGNLTECQWRQIEQGIARSPGTCMTMGTASTLMSIAETLGMTLPGASSTPAALADHPRVATRTGQRIVDMAWTDLKPSKIMTQEAFENAITVDMAIAGSTNAIVHLVAMAGRLNIPLKLETFDEISQRVPVIANIRPSGEHLMADFYDAGGLRALLKRIESFLHLDCLTVNGATLGENIADAEVFNDDIIRPLDQPIAKAGGTFVLRGNLAPQGAVIKPTAAEERLLKHIGPAIVFRDYNHMNERLKDPELEVTADSVLVMQSGGPLGAPGMPEWGMLPIPKKLLEQGVRDMVRISDSRMSGTSYGTCVLHVSPESFVGGPIALVQDGDMIELDVEKRLLHLHVSDEELAKRADAWEKPEAKFTRGYGKFFSEQVTQAHEGCDFRILHSGSTTPEAEIH